jgi:hypothetical protein
LLHPRRDVALAVQHAPDLDVLRALDVEDKVGISRQRRSKRGDAGWTASTERCYLSVFAEVAGNRLINVPVGQFTRNDWPGRHPCAPSLAVFRTRSRSPSK